MQFLNVFMGLTCDEKHLKWIFIEYGIYQTCEFYIISLKARGFENTNRLINTA